MIILFIFACIYLWPFSRILLLWQASFAPVCFSLHHLSLICNTSGLRDYFPGPTRLNICLNYKVHGQRLATRLLGSKSGVAFKSTVRGVKGANFSEGEVKGVPGDGQHIRGEKGGRWVIAMWRGGFGRAQTEAWPSYESNWIKGRINGIQIFLGCLQCCSN